MSVASSRPLPRPPPRAAGPAQVGAPGGCRSVHESLARLISWSMAPFYRRYGRRWPRVVALWCSGLLAVASFAVALDAAAAPAPGPLAHAPGFRLAFGQQVLAGPSGGALDPKGDAWVSA